MWIKRFLTGRRGPKSQDSLPAALERVWGRGPTMSFPHPKLPTLHYYADALLPQGDLCLTSGLTSHLRGKRSTGVELGFVLPGQDPPADLKLVGALVSWVLQCEADEPEGLVHLGHTLNTPAGEAELFRGFPALLFHYPTFLDPAALPLRCAQPGGGEQTVMPLLCAPLTQSEWDLKRARGFEALAEELERTAAGWEAWGPRSEP